MKILFTGGSSFSGLWFVRELVAEGNDVTCCFQKKNYDGLRKQRVDLLQELCHPIFDCKFGDDKFLKVVEDGFDLYCHHAADVTDYKSPDFDVAKALANNTFNLKNVLQRHSGSILLTGSIFEQHEGGAVSPYGLSKGLTADVFDYYCRVYGKTLAKFVIPNPFGPYEEPRYTTYLAKTWLGGHKAQVKTPDYVRDNIPISLLAKAYAAFAKNLSPVFRPSCYAESQGAFTARFAKEMQCRLQIPCAFEMVPQTDFSEPKIRIGRNPLKEFNWSESRAWDELANYYQRTFK